MNVELPSIGIAVDADCVMTIDCRPVVPRDTEPPTRRRTGSHAAAPRRVSYSWPKIRHKFGTKSSAIVRIRNHPDIV